MDPFLLFMLRACHTVKGLTSWLACVFLTFPCGVLGQVWYLVVSIPENLFARGATDGEFGYERVSVPDTGNWYRVLFICSWGVSQITVKWKMSRELSRLVPHVDKAPLPLRI